MDFFTSLVESFTNNQIAEQRSDLSAQCHQVVEEPTDRGFRVKLII